MVFTMPTLTAPTFDTPVDMLRACHDQVRRFSTLSLRLCDHVTQHGADDQASQAAANILRYFNVAAPLHHADEEDDLFPALRRLNDPVLTATLDALEAEHEELAQLWTSTVRPWLQDISRQEAVAPPAAVAAFAQRYPAHAAREEREVFDLAHRLAADTLAGIGTRMRQRREASA